MLKFGGQLRFSKSRYNYRSEIGQEFDLGDGTVGVSVDSVRVSLRPESTETGAYLATRLQPLDRLVVELGGRYDYRTHTSDSDISPRIQAALELTTSATLRASWGAYFQSHGIDELSAVDGDTLFFPSERANQIAAGIEHGFARGWQVRAEVYHRTMSHPRPRYLNVIREIIPFPEVGNAPLPRGWRSCTDDSCLQLLVNERPGEINSLRLPPYHRMDIRVTRTFQVGGGTLSAFLDVFNLYNRENLRSYDYKVELPSGKVIQNVGETLLPILPSFGFDLGVLKVLDLLEQIRS